MRIFAYGIPLDYLDEYLRIGEDTTMESVCHFCKVMMRVYGPTYLRAPYDEDTARLMAENEQRGWPGILGT
jgi:tRNA G26 N,N-dimethylase Trm1